MSISHPRLLPPDRDLLDNLRHVGFGRDASIAIKVDAERNLQILYVIDDNPIEGTIFKVIDFRGIILPDVLRPVMRPAVTALAVGRGLARVSQKQVPVPVCTPSAPSRHLPIFCSGSL